LASRVGEAARVLEDEMLVDYHGSTDVDFGARLAARVARLLENPGRIALGMRNIEKAKANFDYTVLSTRVCHLIDSLLARKSAKREVLC
jgi:hypothetical protein